MNQIAVKRDSPSRFSPVLGFVKKPIVLGVIIGVANFIIIFFMLLTSIMPEQYDMHVGDIPQTPIIAPRDVEDALATKEQVREARDNVSPIYRFDLNITESVLDDINRIFEQISEVRVLASQKIQEWERQNIQVEQEAETQGGEVQASNEDGEKALSQPEVHNALDGQFFQMLQSKFIIMLSKDEIYACIKAEESELIELQDQLISTLDRLLQLRIKQDNLLEAKSTLREEIMSLPVSNEVRMLGTTIGTSVLKPNMLYDHKATEEERQIAAEQVDKVMFKKGQYIVQAGQPITEQQYAVLQKLGLLKDNKMDTPLIIGVGMVILIIEIIVALYLAYFERETALDSAMLLMISLIVWMVLGLSMVTLELNAYLIPAALAGMLISVLLKSRIAIIINMALALLIGIMQGSHLGIVTMIAIGGMGGILIVSRTQQRNGLMWAGVVVSCINILTIAGFEMLSSGGWAIPLKTSLWGIGSGMLSGIFLVGTLPLWENLFGIVTPIKLVELSNPNHPVLKRLLMEAPGTYHHSIIVANLAESAAEAIEANGLLARIGSYYHDIGKLKRPLYFRENQLAIGNPHDKLNPTLSTHIITSHTKDGIDIAKKNKVPKVVQDFILQHHGTTPVIYFYHKAKSQEKGEEVQLEDFRYSGPKPKTREAAIVMMADTVEAAVRALPEPTPGKVEGLIRKLIKEKLDDGQLDECHLTLKDLNTIATAFTGVMTGVFHERVEYPSVNLKKEQEGEESDGRE